MTSQPPTIRQPIAFFPLCVGLVLLAGSLRGADEAPSPVPAVAEAGAAQPAAAMNAAVSVPGLPAAQTWPNRDQLPTENSWQLDGSGSGWMWRYLLSLLAVGGLMVGTFLALRRMRGMLGGTGVDPGLRIVSRLPLDKHNGLYLLRTSREVLTIASGPQGVQVLARRALTAEDAEAAPPAAPSRASFGRLLRAKAEEESSQ